MKKIAVLLFLILPVFASCSKVKQELSVATALGGRGGGMGSLKSKYDEIWEDCARDGIITYYNSDGSINHTSQYDWGKEIK